MSRIRRGTEEEWRTFAREVFEIRYKLMDVFMNLNSRHNYRHVITGAG